MPTSLDRSRRVPDTLSVFAIFCPIRSMISNNARNFDYGASGLLCAAFPLPSETRFLSFPIHIITIDLIRSRRALFVLIDVIGQYKRRN